MAIKAEVDFQLLENQRQVLQAAAVVNTELGERLRTIIANELKAARDRIVADIRFNNGDPRGTAHSIRRSVYQKLLGGNINILDGRGGGSVNSYEAPRKVYPGMTGYRGGNRRLRSQRTQDILSYGPVDRQFILRFVNSGTHPRYANGRNGKWNKQGNNRTFFIASVVMMALSMLLLSLAIVPLVSLVTPAVPFELVEPFEPREL